MADPMVAVQFSGVRGYVVMLNCWILVVDGCVPFDVLLGLEFLFLLMCTCRVIVIMLAGLNSVIR